MKKQWVTSLPTFPWFRVKEDFLATVPCKADSFIGPVIFSSFHHGAGDTLSFHPPLHQPEKGFNGNENKSCVTNQNAQACTARGVVWRGASAWPRVCPGRPLGWTRAGKWQPENSHCVLPGQRHQGDSGRGPRCKRAVRLALVNGPGFMVLQGRGEGSVELFFFDFLPLLSAGKKIK